MMVSLITDNNNWFILIEISFINGTPTRIRQVLPLICKQNCYTALKEAKDKENEGFDHIGRPGGHNFGIQAVRVEGIWKPYRQRSPSCPRRIPLANLPQILPLRLLREATHLRRSVTYGKEYGSMHYLCQNHMVIDFIIKTVSVNIEIYVHVSKT